MVTRRGLRGFTLVELMIGLALSAMLALLALPFTVSWTKSARQLQVRGDLADAIGRAKALALRNAALRLPTQAVSRVRVVDGSIEVWNVGTAARVWSAAMPSDVRLRLADRSTDYACTSFNSRGWPIDDGVCSQLDPTLALMVDGQETLNVELL